MRRDETGRLLILLHLTTFFCLSRPESCKVMVLLYNVPLFGAWRSLAARFVRVEEVVGSNPAAPTDKKNGRFSGGERPFYFANLPAY